MTTLRRFKTDDLFRFNEVNLDKLTETYHISFYLQYMAEWPELFTVAEASNGNLMGYVMGKVEGQGTLWHGHVTALTVGPQYRHQGLAKELMNILESVSDQSHRAYFVDLFVRVSNAVAIGMYKKFGYTVYRRVLEYYAGAENEDAFDMRKALPRDVHRSSIVPLGRAVYPHELEWW